MNRCGCVAARSQCSVLEDDVEEFPECRKCGDGDLVPLSDFGSQGAPIHYKAWVCTNPSCGYNIKIRNGDVFIGEPINDGARYVSRSR